MPLARISGFIGSAAGIVPPPPPPANTPYVVGTASTYSLTAANPHDIASFTIPDQTVDKLVVAIHDDTTTSVTSATWTATGSPAQALTQRREEPPGGGQTSVEVWDIVNPNWGTASGAGVLSITRSLSNPCSVIVYPISQAAATAPIAAGQNGTGTSDPAALMIAAEPFSLIFDVVCGDDETLSIDFAVDETEDWDADILSAWRAGAARKSIGAAGGGGGGTVGPIESVSGATQIAISVGSTPRQTWWGYGWGAGSEAGAPASYPNMVANVTKLCEDMGATVVRFFTPEHIVGTPNFTDTYGPWWDVVKLHGIDTILSSSFILSAQNNPALADPLGPANGIHAAINNGINPTRWAATLQNEPDTPGAGGYVTYESEMRANQQEFRDRLNELGRNSVITLGLEWRHPRTASKGQKEYDDNNALGRVGAGLAVGEGMGHIYDKSFDNNDYDARYYTKGLGLWSTETGNMSSPSAVARFMAGINHGSVVEISHQAIASTDNEDSVSQSQKLIAASGTPRPWYYACRELSSRLPRGTVFRLCTSSTIGTMIYASNAIDHIVIAGLRPDGKWLIAACVKNATATEQFTVTVPELSGQAIEFSGSRTSSAGTVTATTSNMQDGVTRFTLAVGETIVLVAGETSATSTVDVAFSGSVSRYAQAAVSYAFGTSGGTGSAVTGGGGAENPIVRSQGPTVGTKAWEAAQAPQAVGITGTSYVIAFNARPAFMWENVDIPQGATINSATIRFTSSTAASGSTTWEFRFEQAPNPAFYQAINGDVSARSYGGAINWSPAAWAAGQSDATTTSPDLASLIQPIINGSFGTWTSGNRLAVALKSGTTSGYRSVATDEHTMYASPVLTIDWTAP